VAWAGNMLLQVYEGGTYIYMWSYVSLCRSPCFPCVSWGVHCGVTMYVWYHWCDPVCPLVQ